MKLGIASDLHLSFGEMNPEFFDWRGDVLLLAGDLDEDDFLRKHCRKFFDQVSEMATWVLIIAGNHEFYRSELDTTEGHLRKFLEEWSNIILLKNEVFRVAHVDIFGGTMWTDYHGSPIAEWHAQANLNDFKKIRIKGKAYRKIIPRDILVEYQKCYNALLDFLYNDEDGRTKVVMTHHAPSMQSVPPRYRNDYELNKAYCNHFERLIEENPRISTWVHGHTHDFFQYKIGETDVFCNPRGYPGERPAHLPPYQPVSFEL